MLNGHPATHDGRDQQRGASPRVLVTAGPTHEPIDAVRYIANRSSGRLGVALADEAARRGWGTTLLLGPTHLTAADSRVVVERFRTAADLQTLVDRLAPGVDVIVQAAAVADYRPKPRPTAGFDGKLRRDAAGLVLELESTPDIIGGYAPNKRAGQLIVGFALEPRERMVASAREKLGRKGLDLIVANPLETMDSPMIEATVLGSDGSEWRTEGPVPKVRFAALLLDVLEARLGRRPTAAGPGGARATGA